MENDGIIFLSIVGIIIGLAIQYFLIKGAITHALKEHSEKNKTNTEKQLLEMIAFGVGDKTLVAEYVRNKRIKEYNKKVQELKETYHSTAAERTEKIRSLKEEYADLLNKESKEQTL